ncbi:MAG: acetyl-CoA decarbonylase/synthase complex subunit gamma [Candidatus Bathyarchaeota archaeon]|nr:MAG: acetyl-CoA decarbonylase/synthase complex subunit gamma [Candidatus Bathyarchaeota archaeon]
MSKSISPLEVYKLLPKTNCKECGEENCMAFATKLVNREVSLEKCTPLLKDFMDDYQKLWNLLKPPIREIVIGTGNNAVKIGGKFVMYRHELTYNNSTAIALDVDDEMSSDALAERVKWIEKFTYEYIGMDLKLDLIAIRSISNNQLTFRNTVKNIIDSTDLPLILCSFNPNIIEAGLIVSGKNRPLIYAANSENWKEMAELALMYNCPLVVFAPNDLKLLKSLTKTLLEYGVKDLVLDPGTFIEEGLGDTVANFTLIRRAALKDEDELFGFPLIATPIVAWIDKGSVPEVDMWREAKVAAMLINRYSDVMVMHSAEAWVILPNVVLRQNIYTDPRKPTSVEPGLRMFGDPDEKSPIMITTNFALTFYTVAADIESSKIDCYLLVVDSEGISVDSAVAGRQLTADKIADALKESTIKEKLSHKKLIIPGRAARLQGETEDVTGWEIIVGPMDSSGIPKFIKEKWIQ